MEKEGVTMSMPWFKMYADFYYCPKVQSMSEAMQRRFIMLLCLRCAGELQRLDDEEVRTALRISLKQWIKTKVLFITKGFMDQHLNLLNWEKRQARYAKPATDEAAADDAQEAEEETQRARAAEEKRKKDRERKARQRQKEADAKAANVDVTPVTLNVTPVTPDVTKNSVTYPENSPKNLLENHIVTACHANSLDLDLDLDSKSLKTKATRVTLPSLPPTDDPVQAKAKATRETTAQAPPSTPGEDVTDVTKAKATATADSLPADGLPEDTPLSAVVETPASLPADPAVAFDSSTVPAARPANDPARPELSEMPFKAPSTLKNSSDKGIIHAYQKRAENEEKPMTSKKPAQPAPAKPLKPAPISLKHYLQIRHERGLPVIDDDHPIDQWAKERHFPPAFLGLAWEVFAEKYSKGFGKRYAYEYWQERFFDSVKTNQYRLWRIDPQTKQYRLTQTGLQAFMDIDIKKEREKSKAEIKELAPPMASQTTENKPDDDDEGDGGAWFLTEFKERHGYSLSDIFSPQQLISNANIH